MATEYDRVIIFKEPVPDRALPGYVIATEWVTSESSCRVKCYLEDNCVSINVGPGKDGKQKCELNNATDESPSHAALEERPGYIHYAIEVCIIRSVRMAKMCIDSVEKYIAGVKVHVVISFFLSP